MLSMGVNINAVSNTEGLRVPTDKGGVGMVNSVKVTDPDRGFRGTVRDESPAIKINNT